MRAAAGTNEEEREISADSTVHQLLDGLCGTYGEAFRGEVFRRDGENIRDDLILSLNGAIIEHRNVIAANMTSGDVVALFPIFPGGG
jgi:molybdopterin converting factor small subunit